MIEGNNHMDSGVIILAQEERKKIIIAVGYSNILYTSDS
jgi:hypothetical protein